MSRSRPYPLSFNDDFRNLVASAIFLPLIPYAVYVFRNAERNPAAVAPLISAICGSVIVALAIYVVWTHLLFTRTPYEEAMRIARLQVERKPRGIERALGSTSTGQWAVGAVALALVFGIVAAVIGAQSGGMLLPILVALTAASSWATMVYAFALRYFRLHAAGEKFVFEIAEEPRFGDFVSLSVGMSTAGLSVASARGREGLAVMRTHSIITFVFNIVVVAMLVAILAGFITG